VSERLRKAVETLKALTTLRVPPYELPADSFLERAALEILNGAGWQPIATAPKDETTLLLAIPGSEHGVVIGFWSEEYQDWFESEISNNPIDVFNGSPTHWMLLPEPPP